MRVSTSCLRIALTLSKATGVFVLISFSSACASMHGIGKANDSPARKIQAERVYDYVRSNPSPPGAVFSFIARGR